MNVLCRISQLHTPASHHKMLALQKVMLSVYFWWITLGKASKMSSINVQIHEVSNRTITEWRVLEVSGVFISYLYIDLPNHLYTTAMLFQRNSQKIKECFQTYLKYCPFHTWRQTARRIWKEAAGNRRQFRREEVMSHVSLTGLAH